MKPMTNHAIKEVMGRYRHLGKEYLPPPNLEQILINNRQLLALRRVSLIAKKTATDVGLEVD